MNHMIFRFIIRNMSIRLYVSQSEGEFAWDEKTQGIILGAFFLGYVTTNVPGGRMAEKVGGKLIYGLGVFLTAVLTVISPFAAYWGLIPFLFVRVAEGFTEVNLLLYRVSRNVYILYDIFTNTLRIYCI